MAKTTEKYIQIGVPFAVPFLGINEPTTVSINQAHLQLAVRSAFGLSSAPSEDQTKEIQERIAKLEHEKSERAAKKSYAVVTGGEKVPSTPAADISGKDTGSAKRRKA